MKTIWLTFLLLGCAATPPKDLIGPDGTPHKLLTCFEVEDCYKDAIKVCGKYKIINTSTEVDNGTSGSISLTRLLIKCEG